MLSFDEIKSITFKLLAYCKENEWKGYDPYDALNSPFFKYIQFFNSRWLRIFFTQLLKKSPLNFRPLLKIPKTENPKAIALFLMSFLKLKKIGLLENDNLINLMIQKLINLRSPIELITPKSINSITSNNISKSINSTNSIKSSNASNLINSSRNYWCWGYSFPWQTRTILVPKYGPNLVCTSFVANSLLDAYDVYQQSKYLEIALSAADYILNELFWEDSNGVSSFSYPIPSLRTKVHNANFIGSAILARIYSITGNKDYLEAAIKITKYSVSKQNQDGSWYYGEYPYQRWIDNFHTGYNLCALKSLIQYTGASEFETNLKKGIEFYLKNFFGQNGIVKYFHNRFYPLDIHSIAQSIITLITLKEFNENNISLAQSILKWTLNHMWNEKGFFYYQITNPFISKIPYIRWSQAWMLYSLSYYLELNQ